MLTAHCLLPSAFRFLVFASFQNLETVEAEEVSVAGDGTPARVRVAREHGEPNLPDLAGVRGRSARVVDDPVVRAFGSDARAAEVDHHVIGILLHPGLAEKE